MTTSENLPDRQPGESLENSKTQPAVIYRIMESNGEALAAIESV